MKIISLPRRWGKTHAALEWMKRGPNRILVVANHSRAVQMGHINPDLSGRFVAVGRLREWLLGRGEFEIGIDELDTALEHFIGQSVSIATITETP